MFRFRGKQVNLNFHRGRQDWPVQEFVLVPIKKVPVRHAKFSVRLRESSLRAVHAVHTMLTRMVLFECDCCRERFPAFHPAFAPPAAVAKQIELLKPGKGGVAVCNIEVATWDVLPVPPDATEEALLVAERCSGLCLACHKDIEQQRLELAQGLPAHSAEAREALVVPRRSYRNHMDPLFRFPRNTDLQDLFDSATVVEAMLVALEHMQISFVTARGSGLVKFRKNVISFPQDIDSFARRTRLLGHFRAGDRVDSVRGPGPDARDPQRPPKRKGDVSAEEAARHAVDECDRLVFPATVREVLGDGMLVLDYDHGGDGVEDRSLVNSRITMPAKKAPRAKLTLKMAEAP